LFLERGSLRAANTLETKGRRKEISFEVEVEFFFFAFSSRERRRPEAFFVFKGEVVSAISGFLRIRIRVDSFELEFDCFGWGFRATSALENEGRKVEEKKRRGSRFVFFFFVFSISLHSLRRSRQEEAKFSSHRKSTLSLRFFSARYRNQLIGTRRISQRASRARSLRG